MTGEWPLGTGHHYSELCKDSLTSRDVLLTADNTLHFCKADTLGDLDAAVVARVGHVGVDGSTLHWSVMPLGVTQHVTQVNRSSAVIWLINLSQLSFLQLHSRHRTMIVTNLIHTTQHTHCQVHLRNRADILKTS